jgi:hypothetical protein
MRAYLSGGMEYADGEGVAWRSELHDWILSNLGHDVFNPNVESEKLFRTEYPDVDFRRLKLSDPPRYREIARRLVELDCDEIARRSDYVICYWDEGAVWGAGTKGELTMAKFFGKPVYLVTSFPLHDIPGWVLGCVTETFPDFSNLRAFLASHFSR